MGSRVRAGACARIYPEGGRSDGTTKRKSSLYAHRSSEPGLPAVEKYSSQGRDTLPAHEFDRGALSAKGLGYERLDQLTMEVLLGAR